MEGFDTSTMTYTGVDTTGLQYGHTPNAYSRMTMPPMDNYEHSSNYDAHTYAGSEDMYGLQQQQHQQQHQHHQTTPSIKRFTNGYEDPFSDVVSAFEQPINHETQEGETSVDRDHKLLSFSVPTLDYVLLDFLNRQTSASFTAQLHGMFFLAESPWANPGDGSNVPAELTCYRRNLFQITGSVTLPRTLHYVFTEGEQTPIISQELVVTASESTEGNAVKLISVPWKTPASANNASAAPDDKVEREPPAIPLDMSSIQDLESEYATFPFQWKRLQFRIATANNGRRKELQQHFVLHLRIMATLANGTRVSIATAQSGAIIVRGRSPRNFQSRKDTPLTGSANHVRKQSVIAAHLNRVGSIDSASRLPPPTTTKNEPTSAPLKTEAPAPPMSVTSYYDPNDFSVGPGLFDNTFLPDPRHHQQQPNVSVYNAAMTAIAPDQRPRFDSSAGPNNYPLSSPDLSRPTPGAAPPEAPQPLPLSSGPTKLSLVDDDMPKAPSVSPQTTRHTPPTNTSNALGTSSVHNSAAHPSKRLTTMAPPPPSSTRLPSSFSLNVVSSPDESADLLYEYFPLSLDDWMPPVDAVYRPHVVHHIKPMAVGPEGVMGAGVVASRSAGGVWGGRSKRYFSEDVG